MYECNYDTMNYDKTSSKKTFKKIRKVLGHNSLWTYPLMYVTLDKEIYQMP